MMKKTLLALVMMFAVLITATTALADLDVTSTPGVAVEGILFEYDIDVNASNVTFSDVQPDGFIPYFEPEIDETTGMFSWLPGAMEVGTFNFKVLVTDKDTGDVLVYEFAVEVEPVLDIIEMKIGKTGSTLQVYESGDTTRTFNPGDELTIQLTIKNKYTEIHHELIQDGVPPYIDWINLQGVLVGFNDFPFDLNQFTEDPLYLRAEQEKTVEFTYMVPYNTVTDDYIMTFVAEGYDLDVVKHLYYVWKGLTIPVKRVPNTMAVTGVELVDTGADDVTCSEKEAGVAQVRVTLVNTGSGQFDVTVVVDNTNLGVESSGTIFLPNNGVEQELLLDVDLTNLVGEQNFNVNAFRTSVPEIVYYVTTLAITGENCPVTFTSEVGPVVFVEDTTSDVIDLTLFVDNVETTQDLTFTAEGTENVLVSINAENNMAVTAVADWSGTETFTLTVSDGVSEAIQEVTVTVTHNAADDLPILLDPSVNDDVIKEDENEIFSATIVNPDRNATYQWIVTDADDVVVDTFSGSTVLDEFVSEYHFDLNVGTYTVTLSLVDDTGELLAGANKKVSWTVQVADRPVDIDKFSGSETTNLETVVDPSEVSNFVLENSFGKIEFTDNVDLSEILYLEDVVLIEDGLVAVDSYGALGLGSPAQITLYKAFTNPSIFVSTGFDEGTFVTCTVCEVVPVTSGFGFTVPGFSTYKVVEEEPARITVSDILVSDVSRGDSATVTVTVTNAGSLEALTHVTLELVGVDSKYSAQLSGSLPTTLVAGASATVTLTLSVPSDEDAGRHSIGTVKVTAQNVLGETVEATESVDLQIKSFLVIKSIEINGKSSGDLSVEEENEIEVKVKNEYTQDMENVEVTVRILDVDGDDLEESEEIGDLDEGDTDTVTVTFDLRNEEIDKEEYVIEVTVTGDSVDDNSEHETVETKTASLDLENHKIIVDKASLGSSTLTCNLQTTLQVNVNNVGKQDEEDIVIKVTNDALGLNLKKSNIDLEKFFDSDNEYDTSFNINVDGARAGSYPITIEVFRDTDRLEDTETVTLTVGDCTVQQSTSQGQTSYGDDALAAQLKAQLELDLLSRQSATTAQPQPATTFTTSFRDGSIYMVLLGALTLLVLVALVLAVAVMATRRRR
ncbi:hypothetical protein COV17_01110 [Candidatus Woesearchaeota archaeon CG10_big_fil_rev_8_21_14_0_10_36_11]|nr:MAG: hypothetical protein COV17_01110 [Candidatus Woesearchaeota archaeon CG10_big_fil_rev_8_21_14_0_10_36_11]